MERQLEVDARQPNYYLVVDRVGSVFRPHVLRLLLSFVVVARVGLLLPRSGSPLLVLLEASLRPLLCLLVQLFGLRLLAALLWRVGHLRVQGTLLKAAGPPEHTVRKLPVALVLLLLLPQFLLAALVAAATPYVWVL